MKTLLQRIIDKAITLQFPSEYIITSQGYLDYNEWELCLDHLASQAYEFDLVIDKEFLDMVIEAAKKMKLPENGYDYLVELIPSS